jgi:hypothetical protein
MTSLERRLAIPVGLLTPPLGMDDDTTRERPFRP